MAKLDTNASGAASLLYSAYLGGNLSDRALGIAVDSSGFAYVTGYTDSSDFPTVNQFQTDPDENHTDAFVTKLDTNASGAASLLYSTYLGGNFGDIGNGIAVDSAGHAYVAGFTHSTDFPLLNQFQTDQSLRDAFVTKLDTNASGAASLLYSTYLGGDIDDTGTDIAIDAAGIAYVTGYTDSTNFPTLNNYQTHQVGNDVFVTKLNTNASGTASLLYSTYLGGCNWDESHSIAIDASGNAYVTGITLSSDFPTLNQYQQTYQDGGGDAFVTKLDTNASGAASLLYSTYLGGNGRDFGTGIALDSAGNVYVTGDTPSTNFPTLDALQSDQPLQDAFVTKLDTNASGTASLLYSSYLGGSDYDIAYDIAVDASGVVYVAGTTYSNNFPMINQFQGHQGIDDAFVTKLPNIALISGRVTSDGTNGISGVTITVSGSMPSNTVTDSNGNYSIKVAVGGNYTVTPSKSGLIFIPSEQCFTNLQANQTNVNFIAQAVVTISGKVTKSTATGAGVPDVNITLTGGGGFTPRTTITASDGTYSFSDVPVPNTYTLTPSQTGYTFSPTQLVLNNVTTNQTGKNFIATFTSYTISGFVKIGTAALPGVTVELSSPTPAGFTTRTITTGSTGTYSFINVPAGRDYTVTATKIGYQFTPASKSLVNLSNNQTVNFLVKLYKISGRIMRANSTMALSDVTVTITSPTPGGFTAQTAQTGTTGYYTFGTNLPAGRDYIIEPSKPGYTFSPTTRSITNLSDDIGALDEVANFTGTGP